MNFKSNKQDEFLISKNLKSCAFLRIGSGLLLFFSHGMELGLSAFDYIWNETKINCLSQEILKQIPYNHILVPFLSIMITAIAFSWIFGFLTRLFSCFYLIIIAFLFYNDFFHLASQETLSLYALISLTLLFFGSGMLSADQIFIFSESKLKSKPKKRF
jgi:hypothetical protein